MELYVTNTHTDTQVSGECANRKECDSFPFLPRLKIRNAKSTAIRFSSNLELLDEWLMQPNLARCFTHFFFKQQQQQNVLLFGHADRSTAAPTLYHILRDLKFLSITSPNVSIIIRSSMCVWIK